MVEPGGVADVVGGEGGHGPQDRTEVSAHGSVALGSAGRGAGAGLADPRRSVRRGVERDRRTARSGVGVGSQDAVRGDAAALSRPLRRRPTADAATTRQDVAGHARSGQGSVFRPGSSAGPSRRLRLHAHDRVGGDHCRAGVPAPGVSLRLDAFELGARDALLLGEFREFQRGVPERGVGGRRRAVDAPQRPHEPGGASLGHRGVHASLQGLDVALRRGAASDQCGERPRERRRRAESQPVQEGGEAGVVVARQFRFSQSGRLRSFPARDVCEAEQAAHAAVSRRGPATEGVAGSAAGVVAAAVRAGAVGMHDQRGAEHLLGAGPVDRRAGRGSRDGRHRGGVVPLAARRRVAAVAGPIQAPHQLSARDRVAGAEAGGVRALSLPVGDVPDEPVSPGLRSLGGHGVGPRRPGIPGHSAPGGAAGRVPGRRGVAGVVGQ